MAVDGQRAAERAKYERAYQTAYHMSQARLMEATDACAGWEPGSLVDVGCGRGEFIEAMDQRGFRSVGVECVAYLCGGNVIEAWAHALPFGNGYFDYATSWDVLEHLVPGDDWRMIHEMARVATKGLAFSANNKEVFKDTPGHRDELHINRRAYEEWHDFLVTKFGEEAVAFHADRYSPIWVVTL